MKVLKICLFLLIAISVLSCSEESGVGGFPESEVLLISKFTVKSGDKEYCGDINQENKTIKVMVPSDFDIKKVLIEVEYTEGATLKPENGYSYNFSQPIDFILTKEGIEPVTYNVCVSTSPDIISFKVPEYHKIGYISDSTILLNFNYGTDISDIIPEIKVSPGCSIEPNSGLTINMTEDVIYTVTNLNGDQKRYIVKASIAPQEKEIRGVWVPDPSYTTVLHSYKNVKDFVDLLDDLNLNTIYLGTWAREKTIFKSQVLKNNTNYLTVEDGWALNGLPYDGDSGDPIRDLISLAHERDMKVFFWFEYGFMRSGGEIAPEDHPILSVHPDWDGVNSFDKPANYNGTDFYLNSYDEQVQDFIIDLIKESILLYPDVDGIQGDDHLPASPRNSGYNDITKEQYKKDTGEDVPSNYNDIKWVDWRITKLNDFCKRMYDEIKSINNSIIVSFSPNPYPWCKENLMQDWPNWISGKYADFLSVQCYRDTEDSYRTTVESTLKYIEQLTEANILNPGIYLKNIDGWEELFIAQMLVNQDLETNGEAFFYNEGLKRETNKKVIKSFYTGKAIFPY